MIDDHNPHYIGNRWVNGSELDFASTDPATGETVWHGRAAGKGEVDAVVDAARQAATQWGVTDLEEREVLVESFCRELEARREEFAAVISEETGKPLWESETEVSAMMGKIGLSIQAYRERRSPQSSVKDGLTSATRYKPHGVVAVLGPFNLPGHLPNAHIAPSLVAGNTIVFKPSEQTPKVGRLLTETWLSCGLPAGVLNMIQGKRKTGEILVNHADVDGVFFTGGIAGGRAISRSCADTPGKIVALELGGNNPLVVWEPCDLEAAVYLIVNSAFITAGQRCTCARRLILPNGSFGDEVLERLISVVGNLVIGATDQIPEPFFGPLISALSAEVLLKAQSELLSKGAVELMPSRRIDEGSGSAGGALVSPGIINVTAAKDREDSEIFGPLLQVIRVKNFEDAIAEANNTAFGLSSGLICSSAERYREFYAAARSGIVNWNKPITGASGAQPFGGTGDSGNHRPSGYFAADYCAYPVASTESEQLSLPEKMPPGINW